MSDPFKEHEEVVAKHVSGTDDEEQLNTSIADAWRQALVDRLRHLVPVVSLSADRNGGHAATI